MRVWLLAYVGAAMMTGAAAARADEVPAAVRDLVTEKLAATFLQPQTTLWRWDSDNPYVGSERVVCGMVNFQSAQQRYTGYHQFYAIIDGDAVVLTQIDNPVYDTSGKLRDKLTQLCGPPAASPH